MRDKHYGYQSLPFRRVTHPLLLLGNTPDLNVGSANALCINLFGPKDTFNIELACLNIIKGMLHLPNEFNTDEQI